MSRVLLLLLAAAMVGAQLYVDLEWSYRDAPPNVKAALVLGGLVAVLIAVLLGPALAGPGRRR